MTNSQLEAEIKELKQRIFELEKLNDLNLKSTVVINQNIKTLMTFMKDVGLNQGDIARQVFLLSEAVNSIMKAFGLDKEGYSFFSKDEPWN